MRHSSLRGGFRTTRSEHLAEEPTFLLNERPFEAIASFHLDLPAPRKNLNTTPSPPISRLLVIGYGNTLRRDDGVGPKVADAVAAVALPDVQTLACPQLTPELAEPISQAHLVIFVDAAMDSPREVRFRKLTPAGSSQIMAHAADPSTMLALARDVFGRAPEAWWLTIPVEELGFGEELSALAETGLETALSRIQALVAHLPKA